MTDREVQGSGGAGKNALGAQRRIEQRKWTPSPGELVVHLADKEFL